MPVIQPRPRLQPRFLRAKPIKPVNFFCSIATAKSVTVVGDFNDWHPHATPMKRQPDGCWRVQVEMRSGHHHYQFLVDGRPMLDPRAEGVARNEMGEKVSLVSVGH